MLNPDKLSREKRQKIAQELFPSDESLVWSTIVTDPKTILLLQYDELFQGAQKLKPKKKPIRMESRRN